MSNHFIGDKLWRLLQDSSNANAAVYGNSSEHLGMQFLLFCISRVLQLYLHSAPAIKFHAASIHSAKPLVRFSDTKNPNTLWVAHPLDPKEQLRMPLGIHIPVSTVTLSTLKNIAT